MSKPEDNPTPITIAGDVVENTVVEKQPNILVRGYRKIRKDPKTTLAVVGGTLLVGGAAYLGRKTAPSCDGDLYFVPIDTDVDPEPVEEPDTTVA